MSQDSAEEKKHPPTHQRMRELRERGKAPMAEEARGAVSFVAVLVGLVLCCAYFMVSFEAMVEHSIKAGGGAAASLDAMMRAAATTLGLALAIAAAGGLAFWMTSVVDVGGLLMSAKNVQPDINRINPVKTIKQHFSLQGMTYFLRSLVKAILVILCAFGVAAYRMTDVWSAPSCGVACVSAVFFRIALDFSMLVALLLIVSGALDLKISRALFRRDNRMTDTELKREQKEDGGSPEIRDRRRQIRREMYREAESLVLSRAMAVVYGKAGAVALAAEEGGLGPPVIVRSAGPHAALALREEVKAFNTPCIRNDGLAEKLVRLRRGMSIPLELYQPVADALISAQVMGSNDGDYPGSR